MASSLQLLGGLWLSSSRSGDLVPGLRKDWEKRRAHLRLDEGEDGCMYPNTDEGIRTICKVNPQIRGGNCFPGLLTVSLHKSSFHSTR